MRGKLPLNLINDLYFICLREETFHPFGTGQGVNYSRLCSTPDGIMVGCLTTMKDSWATGSCLWSECRASDKFELHQVSFFRFCLGFIFQKAWPSYKKNNTVIRPRRISSLSSVIVRVSVVLKRTVGDSD